MTVPERWSDLGVRVASATVLIVFGVVAVWLGGAFFRFAVVVVVGAMIWELAGLTAPQEPFQPQSSPLQSSPPQTSPLQPSLPQPSLPQPAIRLGLAGLSALCLWVFPALGWAGWLLLLVPPAGLLVTPRRDAAVLASYALALMLAGVGFMGLRDHGAAVFLWLATLVVASDTMGYFAGRLLGGPKFWPRISPKKTWSGTIAGWFGAGLVGLIFAAFGVVPMVYALLSPLIALASQLGDIVESWIKRRAGAKDSSNLIPGHGGVLDRFDALVGAVLALQLLSFVLALPQ